MAKDSKGVLPPSLNGSHPPHRKRNKERLQGAGSASRRKQQRLRSHDNRKANNTWDKVKEEVMQKKKELQAAMARKRNDSRKFQQASRCQAVRFEGQQNFSWADQACKSYKTDISTLRGNVVTEDAPPPSPPKTPMYDEDSVPFGGADDF